MEKEKKTRKQPIEGLKSRSYPRENRRLKAQRGVRHVRVSKMLGKAPSSMASSNSPNHAKAQEELIENGRVYRQP